MKNKTNGSHVIVENPDFVLEIHLEDLRWQCALYWGSTHEDETALAELMLNGFTGFDQYSPNDLVNFALENPMFLGRMISTEIIRIIPRSILEKVLTRHSYNQ